MSGLLSNTAKQTSWPLGVTHTVNMTNANRQLTIQKSMFPLHNGKTLSSKEGLPRCRWEADLPQLVSLSICFAEEDTSPKHASAVTNPSTSPHVTVLPSARVVFPL